METLKWNKIPLHHKRLNGINFEIISFWSSKLALLSHPDNSLDMRVHMDLYHLLTRMLDNKTICTEMIVHVHSYTLYVYSLLKVRFSSSLRITFPCLPWFSSWNDLPGKQFSFSRTPLKVWEARINVCECLTSWNSLRILTMVYPITLEQWFFSSTKARAYILYGKSFEQLSAHVSHLSTPAFIKRADSMGDGTLKRSWKVLLHESTSELCRKKFYSFRRQCKVNKV